MISKLDKQIINSELVSLGAPINSTLCQKSLENNYSFHILLQYQYLKNYCNDVVQNNFENCLKHLTWRWYLTFRVSGIKREGNQSATPPSPDPYQDPFFFAF